VAAKHHNPSVGEAVRPLILSWYRRARRHQFAYGSAADGFAHLRRALGVSVAVITTAVGGTVFAMLGGAQSRPLEITLGLVSFAGAILSSLLTFLGLDERASQHEASSRDFGEVRRLLAEIGVLAITDERAALDRIAEVRVLNDHASANAPNLPSSLARRFRTWGKDYWPPEFSSWPEYPRASPDSR